MRICDKSSNIFFSSNKPVSSNEDPIGVSSCGEDRNGLNCDEKLPYYSIYDESGSVPNHFGNFINQSAQTSNQESDDIFSLPLKNVRKIDGSGNSYSGQTLLTANAHCMDTIKNAGVKTVVDIDGYFGYKEKIEGFGFDFLEFNTKDFMNSPAVASLRDYKRDQERLFSLIRNIGVDVDVDGYVKRSEEKFRSDTREDINKFVEFINVMQNDNVYVGGESGSQNIDVTLFLNDAFNPKFQDKPLKIPTNQMLNSMFNLYYNLTPDDKVNMGWTKETDAKFFDRMVDRQMELML